MFDTRRFGAYLSRLRKNADMTQSEVADQLNVTRQAVSRYEQGESFPDISILVLLADIFGITLDELISSGEPTRGEAYILGNVAMGNTDIAPQNISDVIGIAPYLKPSVLAKLSARFSEEGLDLSYLVELAQYLNDENTLKLLESSQGSLEPQLLAKLIPFLPETSRDVILQKVFDGEMDWHILKSMFPYYPHSIVEAAVVAGVLPWEALKLWKNQ